MTDNPQPRPAPAALGGYRILEELGAGGMGVVYRARGEGGTEAALKTLHRNAPPEAQSRLMAEGSVRLSHPNVAQVLAAGVDPSVGPWIAFELLRGEALDRTVARAPLAPAEAIHVGMSMAAGLSAAHRAGYLHRDLKPSNVFVCEDGTVKLLDFGVAKHTQSPTRLTKTGHVVGTPAYLSPEQVRGDHDIDARADLWALGVVLFEALTGRCPFARDATLATMLAIMMDEAPNLRTLRPDVPQALADTVARCLRKRRDDRYENAEAVRSALEVAAVGASNTSPAAVDATSDTALSLPNIVPSIAPGEQRVVAVVLADAVEDLDRFRQIVQEQRGVALTLPAGRALAVWGGESWEGDELRLAVEAALEVAPFCGRVAISSGRASYSGTTGIAGAVLQAAETTLAAGAGGVAVDAETAAGLSGFELRPDPAGVFEVRAEGRGCVVARRAETVGRELELAQLRESIRTCLSEERLIGSLVLGPPGIGKSRLRAEAESLLGAVDESVQIVSANAETLGRESAFALFARMVRQQAQKLDLPIDPKAPPEQRREAVRMLMHSVFEEAWIADGCADFVGELLDVPMPESRELAAAREDPSLMLDRIRLALTDWLRALVRRGPVALLLDDLHWADSASLELLADLGDQLTDVPLFLLGTARPELRERCPELLSMAGISTLELRGLAKAEVAALAEAVSGRPLAAELCRTLGEHTGGNPLFVEQIVLALAEEGRLDGDPSDLPLPVSVEAALQSRLDHLPAQAKELCKRAAVLGGPFGAADLGALGVHSVAQGLRELRHAGLLSSRTSRGTRPFFFPSALVREVAYRMIAPALREELHRRAATELAAAADAPPEEVARHFECAGESGNAARWYTEAVRSASRRGDAATTLRCGERALALGVEGEERFTVCLARADAFETVGDLDQQRQALDEAMDAADTAGQWAQVTTDHAVWLLRGGRTDEAVVAAKAATEHARGSGDEHTLALALGRQAAVWIYAGQPAEARAALAEVASLRADSRLRPLLAVWRAQLAGATGDLATRRTSYREAVLSYEANGDLRRAAGAALNLADAENRTGNYTEAERSLRDALEKCRRVGTRLWEGYALANLGYALAMQRRNTEAIEVLREAATAAERTGEARLSLVAKVYAARALRTTDPEQGAKLAGAAAASAGRLGQASMSVLADAVAARCELACARNERALELSARAMARRDELGGVEEDEAEVFLTYAQALGAVGRLDDAAAALSRGRARVRELAALIQDPDERAGFLGRVVANRELMETGS